MAQRTQLSFKSESRSSTPELIGFIEIILDENSRAELILSVSQLR